MLWFVIGLLVLGTIFEFVLHHRQARFLRQQRATAEFTAERVLESNSILSQRIESTSSSNSMLHAQLLKADECARSLDSQLQYERARANEATRTVANLEQSVEVLSDELDRLAVLHAKRVLGGTTMTVTQLDEV